MTATTLTHLPLAAGGALAHSAGRAALWVIAQYMRAPLSNTAIAALVGFSLLAGSNALYGQHGEHPAPLFGITEPAARPAEPQSIPVVPAIRRPDPVPSATVTSRETTGSVQSRDTVSERPVGNAEVLELQRKLRDMGLYEDRVDGLYGPRTARAIRAFEERQGLRPRGELTREIVRTILSTSAVAPAPAAMQVPVTAAPVTPQPVRESTPPVQRSQAVSPLAATEPAPSPTNPVNAIVNAPVAQATPATAAPAQAAQPYVAARPLPPAPVPLAEGIAPLTVGSFEAPAERTAPALRRELPATPRQAMDIAVDTAGDAINTIIQGVQTIAMTSPPEVVRQPMPARPTPTPAAAAPAPVAPAAAPAAAPAPVITAANQPAPSTASASSVSIGAAAFSPHDREMVARIQRGLGSLGFLHGPADGVAGEATARAIRNFEVYYNYDVTGRVSPELVDLLVEKGAVI